MGHISCDAIPQIYGCGRLLSRTNSVDDNLCFYYKLKNISLYERREFRETVPSQQIRTELDLFDAPRSICQSTVALTVGSTGGLAMYSFFH